MQSTNTKRILSVDILRGIVMVIMALDHTRDFFSNFHYQPTDLQHTNAAMFFTRWITHFCAPVFVFLAGTSSMLSFSRGRTKKQASWFLLSRGIWLVILEVTLVRIGWQFDMSFSVVVLQVIWAIGCSMILLSALIFLPVPIITVFGFALVFGHNALDGIPASGFGEQALWWDIVHEQNFVKISESQSLFVIYPLIPWVGVMALGYCFGHILLKPEPERNRFLYIIGGSAIALFIILRFANIYGDPSLWQQQEHSWQTVLSFINCTKYPPSLLYLLMTIGPAIILMPMLENIPGRIANFFTVFGRVPLFYYVLHLYVIHSLALIAGIISGFSAGDFMGNDKLFNPATGWGFSLGGVYAFWILAIAILYLPCLWFMRVKARNKQWWLSYL